LVLPAPLDSPEKLCENHFKMPRYENVKLTLS